MLGSGTPFVTYLYGADGNRVRKSNADGTFTEYVKFAGQPIAQKDENGNWTDSIYANGTKIAQVAGMDNRIHTHGVFTASDNELPLESTNGAVESRWHSLHGEDWGYVMLPAIQLIKCGGRTVGHGSGLRGIWCAVVRHFRCHC